MASTIILNILVPKRIHFGKDGFAAKLVRLVGTWQAGNYPHEPERWSSKNCSNLQKYPRPKKEFK